MTHASHKVSFQVENQLVTQKDLMLEELNNGKIANVLAMLRVVMPLWETVGYHYKGGEIAERTQDLINEALLNTHPRSNAQKQLMELLEQLYAIRNFHSI